jgi:hypothetical protein
LYFTSDVVWTFNFFGVDVVDEFQYAFLKKMQTFAQTYLPSITKNQWKEGKFHLIGTIQM